MKLEFAPILVIAFNRYDSTKEVIQALVDQGVREIYFAVDGPRISNYDDLSKVARVRELVDEYKTQLRFKTLFQDKNLGCRLAVTTAINWLFSQEEFGIILEDDCLPSSGFLRFATRILNKYENNQKIMHIGGSSYLKPPIDYHYNHYFTSFHEVWGWATWARAWRYFQLDPGSPSSQEDEMVLNYFNSKGVFKWFNRYLSQARSDSPSVWSTQWSLSIIKNHGIAVNPINNLVKNIGFNSDSTHSSGKSFRYYDSFEVTPLSLLSDPPIIEINRDLDKKRFKVIQKTDPSLFVWNIVKFESRSFFIQNLPKGIILMIRTVKLLFGQKS